MSALLYSGRSLPRWLFLVTALGAAPPLAAQWSGAVELEGRRFAAAPAYPGQQRDGVALRLRALYTREWGEGSDYFTCAPVARIDSADAARSTLDLDELGWTHLMSDSELRLGLRKLFWGVAESNHLVDIVNQTDLVDNPDGESKLAQPMVNLALFGTGGTLDLFLLPGFRERTFPGTAGRLRTPLPVAENPHFEADQGRGHLDWAARWHYSIGTLDLALSGFHGTSREPNLTVDEQGRHLLPFYPLIDQAGLELQYIDDALIWKLEAIRRRGSGQRFSATVAGFEYTFYGLADGRSDATTFVEYSWDGRDAQATYAMDNDLFLGVRFNLNDTSASELMLGWSHDLDGGGEMWMVEGQRRLDDNWRIGLEGRGFQSVDAGEAAYPLRHDTFIQFTLERFF